MVGHRFSDPKIDGHPMGQQIGGHKKNYPSEIVNPSPTPSWLSWLSNLPNILNNFPISSSFIPVPVSFTSNLIYLPLFSLLAVTVTLPFEVNFNAFPTKFIRIWFSLFLSVTISDPHWFSRLHYKTNLFHLKLKLKQRQYTLQYLLYLHSFHIQLQLFGLYLIHIKDRIHQAQQ